jgi:hypothetical protein
LQVLQCATQLQPNSIPATGAKSIGRKLQRVTETPQMKIKNKKAARKGGLCYIVSTVLISLLQTQHQ